MYTTERKVCFLPRSCKRGQEGWAWLQPFFLWSELLPDIFVPFPTGCLLFAESLARARRHLAQGRAAPQPRGCLHCCSHGLEGSACAWHGVCHGGSPVTSAFFPSLHTNLHQAWWPPDWPQVTPSWAPARILSPAVFLCLRGTCCRCRGRRSIPPGRSPWGLGLCCQLHLALCLVCCLLMVTTQERMVNNGEGQPHGEHKPPQTETRRHVLRNQLLELVWSES